LSLIARPPFDTNSVAPPPMVVRLVTPPFEIRSWPACCGYTDREAARQYDFSTGILDGGAAGHAARDPLRAAVVTGRGDVEPPLSTTSVAPLPTVRLVTAPEVWTLTRSSWTRVTLVALPPDRTLTIWPLEKAPPLCS